VHLRRALLLFAIVLALAAVAASISRPRDESDEMPPRPAPPPTETQRPELAPGTAADAGPPVTLVVEAGENGAARVQAGRAATLEVGVEEPGEIGIPDLGVSTSAEPLTPARFDLLVREPGRYPLEFTPAAGDEPESVGTLVVVEPKR
jgi:hypothetical protein